MKLKFFPQYILLAFIGIVMTTQTSCMGMMMMGGRGDHNEHQATTITKEVINGDFTLSISIEPMTVGKEGKIVLSLRSKTSVPDSVAGHYMISKSSTGGNSSSHDHNDNASSGNEFKTIHQNIVMMKGASTITYVPTAGGSFILTVEVENISTSDSSFSVETDFMVHEQKSKGMMGMGGMWDYPVLGVVVMGTMMIGMWALGARVF